MRLQIGKRTAGELACSHVHQSGRLPFLLNALVATMCQVQRIRNQCWQLINDLLFGPRDRPGELVGFAFASRPAGIAWFELSHDVFVPPFRKREKRGGRRFLRFLNGD